MHRSATAGRMAGRSLLATPTASLLQVLLVLMATAGEILASNNTNPPNRPVMYANAGGECPQCPPCPSATGASAKPMSAGYDYYAGLGYYKMHYVMQTWPDAQAACERDGGYLIVINSQAEADMASQYMNKYNLTGYIHAGFIDATHKGDYETVLGTPLESTGYTVWEPKEPNNLGRENCGSFWPNVGLNDMECSARKRFLCEFRD